MKKILVPTDFSAIAGNAARYALELAKVMNSEIVFFHANEHSGSDEYKRLKAEVATISALNPSVKSEFVATDKLFNSMTITDIFRTDIGLIVMGTSGEHAAFSKKIFGTNTSQIIENMNCPVIAVPDGYAYSDIKNIAYASDLNRLEEEIILVIDFARRFNADVQVFHVSPVFPDLGDVEKIDAQSKIEALKQQHGYPAMSYSVEKTTNDNQINKGIVKFLSHHAADLLILFHNNREGIDKFFSSSTAEKAITHIKTPLLIFPKSIPRK